MPNAENMPIIIALHSRWSACPEATACGGKVLRNERVRSTDPMCNRGVGPNGRKGVEGETADGQQGRLSPPSRRALGVKKSTTAA